MSGNRRPIERGRLTYSVYVGDEDLFTGDRFARLVRTTWRVFYGKLA